MSLVGDALAVRERLPGGALICALYEAHTCRELLFEDVDAALLFAKLRRISFEAIEQRRRYRAEDYLDGSGTFEVTHGIVK